MEQIGGNNNMASSLPDTISPEQMTSLQSAPAPVSGTPDVISPEQMNSIQTPSPKGNAWVSAGRWLANTAKNIEQPFVSVAATPVQLLAKHLGQPDPFADNQIGLPGESAPGIPVAPVTPAGMYQKAGQLAQIATLALTPEAAGPMGIAKLAALGATGGMANVVAGGGKFNANPFGSGEMPEAMRQGALYGGILGGLGNAARAISYGEKGLSSVSDSVAKDIQRAGVPIVSKYIDTAINSNLDSQAQTVDGLLSSDIRKGASILTGKIIPDAGKAVGEARKAAADSLIMYQEGNTPVAGVNAVPVLIDDINSRLQDMTGHQFSSYGSGGPKFTISNYAEGPTKVPLSPDERSLILNNGESSSITPLPGRPAAELPSADMKRFENLFSKLQTLQSQPTVQTAQDVIHSLDNNINWDKPAQNPIEGVLRYARGAINNSIRSAAPDLAAANQRFGELKDVQGALESAAGSELQHLDLLARRTLYRGQSDQAQSVLQSLHDEVAPYLPAGEPSYVTKAAIAKWTSETFAGKRGESGLGQSIRTGDIAAGASGYTSRIVSSAMRLAQRALSPDSQQYALSIAKGEPYSFVPAMHHIDEILDSKSAIPWINSFKKGLQNIGVTSSNVGQGSKDMLRMMMFQNLMSAAANKAAANNPPPVNTPDSTPLSAPQSSAPARPLASSQTVRNLTPATTGQGMAAQARSLGVGAVPTGMSVSNTAMNA